jgi:hypothetical protein
MTAPAPASEFPGDGFVGGAADKPGIFHTFGHRRVQLFAVGKILGA